jgi:hypothetical protein
VIARLVQLPWDAPDVSAAGHRPYVYPDLVTDVFTDWDAGRLYVCLGMVGGGTVRAREFYVRVVSGAPGPSAYDEQFDAAVAEVAAWVDAHRSVLPTIEVLPTERIGR